MALVAAAARDPIIWRQGGHEILEINFCCTFQNKIRIEAGNINLFWITCCHFCRVGPDCCFSFHALLWLLLLCWPRFDMFISLKDDGRKSELKP